MDASQAQTDVDSFAVLEPTADGFRNYARKGFEGSAAALLVDRASLMTLTAPEMTVLVGGLRALNANVGQAKHGVFTRRPEALTSDFFVNLLDMSTKWHAIAHPPDLLVVPARGDDPSGPDSVTQHLFRKCPVPVWSVYPGRAPFPRRVLAAVDPGVSGSVERDLARRVLELALRVAGTGPIELHAAHAWSVPAEALIRSKFGSKRTQAFLDQQRRLAREQLEELITEAHLEPSVAGTHLPAGDPASAIPALAEELDADLVVLGSSGHKGLAGILIGSTAEAIVTRMARSVAVVKPAWYLSPVRPLEAAAEIR